jgi:Calpain family cysteine protease
MALNAPEDAPNSGAPVVEGLYGNHAYSLLRAVECKGKRFVVVRNPWGNGEWTGRWSDGAKEWTPEWLEILPQLGHTFGDDGQFVMECMSFLNPLSSNADISKTRISCVALIRSTGHSYSMIAGSYHRHG